MTTRQLLAIGALIVLAAVAGYYVFVTGKFNPFQAAEVWPPRVDNRGVKTALSPATSVPSGDDAMCVTSGITTIAKNQTQAIEPTIGVNAIANTLMEVRFSTEITAQKDVTIALLDWRLDGNPVYAVGPEYFFTGAGGFDKRWTTQTAVVRIPVPKGAHTIRPVITSLGGKTAIWWRCLSATGNNKVYPY
jgi:hypothetical protein